MPLFKKKLGSKANSGFSLVEMVIYVTLLVVIFLIVVNTILSFTGSYQSLRALRALDHSSVSSMERITRDIRGATSVDTANSTLGTSPGVLTLTQTVGSVSTTTKFYLQGGVVKVDVNGVYSGPLTLTGTSVTNLVFTKLTSSISSAVKVDLTVSATVGTTTKTKIYHSTVILRGS